MKTFTVIGSYGSLVCDFDTGEVINAEKARDYLRGIARVDVAEYREWAAREMPEWVADEETDIILIGYTTHAGAYVAADAADRAHCLENVRAEKRGAANPGFCCAICGAGFDFGCNCSDE